MGGKPRKKLARSAAIDNRVPLSERTDPSDRACLGCAVYIATKPKTDPRFCSETCGYMFAIGESEDEGCLAYDFAYCTFCDWWWVEDQHTECPSHLAEEEGRLALNRPGKFAKLQYV
jgi:hypothetical protein